MEKTLKHRPAEAKRNEITKRSLVSVIIPCYNSKEFLSEAIASVLAQSYQKFEIIVIDDSSTDGSFEIIQGIANKDPRIRCARTPTNSGGPATPRNIGLGKASGELIAFLDADDIWLPTKLAHQISLLDVAQVDMVCSDVFVLDKITTHLNRQLDAESSKTGVSEALNFRKLLKKNRVALSSVLIKRACLDNHPFSPLKEHIAVEDYFLWLQLHSNPNFRSCWSNQKLVGYRLRRDSLSAGKWSMARKVWALLGRFDLTHIPMGLGRLWYFSHYVFLSICNRCNSLLRSN